MIVSGTQPIRPIFERDSRGRLYIARFPRWVYAGRAFMKMIRQFGDAFQLGDGYFELTAINGRARYAFEHLLPVQKTRRLVAVYKLVDHTACCKNLNHLAPKQCCGLMKRHKAALTKAEHQTERAQRRRERRKASPVQRSSIPYVWNRQGDNK